MNLTWKMFTRKWNCCSREHWATPAKIHSGRSRNDQILVDLKLFARAEIRQIVDLTAQLIDVLLAQSNRYKDVLMPGYTHLQVAMPPPFGLWFALMPKLFATICNLCLPHGALPIATRWGRLRATALLSRSTDK